MRSFDIVVCPAIKQKFCGCYRYEDASDHAEVHFDAVGDEGPVMECQYCGATITWQDAMR